MKNNTLIFILAALLYLLLWEAEWGLNLLLFSLFTSAALRWVKPQIFSRREVQLLLVAWCYSGLSVVIHHSDLSVVIYWTLCFITMGYLQEERVRFWVFGGIESMRALFLGWLLSLRKVAENWQSHSGLLPQLARLKLFLAPLLIMTPFYFLYSQANTTFAQIQEQILNTLSNWIHFDLNWSQVWVFCLCWVLVIALLGQRSGISKMHELAKSWRFDLVRRRAPDPFHLMTNSRSFSSLALKREYQMAVLTFVALNILLFFINMLDISTVWLVWDIRPASDLSQFVHTGTWLLILSILLAMLVVLVFLRGNLNFLKDSSRLKQLAYLWLAQNAFLALSVGVRNGHYIHQYALAHGRIVVAFFLILVLFGLYTMYQKVKGPKTTFYLLQTNGVALLVALLVAVTYNWDSLITRYNLAYAQSDQYHLVYRLDNNLVPLIDAVQSKSQTFISEADIKYREEKFMRELKTHDWRSWNWSNYRQYQALQDFHQTDNK